MNDIGVFTPEQARAIWQDYQSRKQFAPQQTQNLPQRRPIEQVRLDYCVILDAALAVATNSKTGPTSCLARVCYWDQSISDYVESTPTRQVTVYNHSESTAHAINTFGVARRIDGHWWFFGDCQAMASR